MITEEDAAKHAGLQPEQRFYLTERLCRERLAAARKAASGTNDWPEYDEFDYMIEVKAAAEAFGIGELDRWQLPSRSDDEAQGECRNFRAEATKVSQRLMYRYAGVPDQDPNTVALDAATKEKLRFHLAQVRGIIDADPMPAWKKQELYDAIAELECEIDKARTRVGAVLDVLGRVWDGELRAVDALRQIVAIVQDAKAKERQQAKLAAPVLPKQLTAPSPELPARKEPKRLEGPYGGHAKKKNGFDKALDEEIPF